MELKNELEQLRQAYKDDPSQETFNSLILGESGTGKTFLARTCRLPIHIDSFDPGGTKCLQDLIARGDVIPDTLYEHEDPLKPTMFVEWKRRFEDRVRSSYFNNFGTYFLDSATTWSSAIMNKQLDKNSRAGTAPKFTKDYTPQKAEIRNWLTKILQLPCDVIVTGHLKLIEDPIRGHIFRFLTTGDGTVVIPLLFDEIYVTTAKEVGGKVEYSLITNHTEHYFARSRLAGSFGLDLYMDPNIKAILKKTGHNYQDKPRLEF
jgi:hypothetical protein